MPAFDPAQAPCQHGLRHMWVYVGQDGNTLKCSRPGCTAIKRAGPH